MNETKQKNQPKEYRIVQIAKSVVCVLFVCLLILPFLFLDTSEEIFSKLENRLMTRWPGVDLTGQYNEWYGHYVEDRVAFREPAIKAYMRTNYALFHEFSEKLHMYGKDAYVFPADAAYIKAYQHEATDEALIDDFVTFLDRTNQYLQEQDITFVFMAGLDKKTVYGRYMPDSIHVNEENESIMEMLDRMLTEKNVPHVIPVKEFVEKSKNEQIYNVMYDCAHWNEKGALYGIQLLDQEIAKEHPQIPVLLEKDFKLTHSEKTIEFIELPLKEKVPTYRLRSKYKKKVEEDPMAAEHVSTEEGTNMIGYVCNRKKCDQTILVIHDSFLEGKEKFFKYRYARSYFVPRRNYEHIQEYVETLHPDVVVFENAERAFVDDLYAYTELANITYK